MSRLRTGDTSSFEQKGLKMTTKKHTLKDIEPNKLKEIYQDLLNDLDDINEDYNDLI